MLAAKAPGSGCTPLLAGYGWNPWTQTLCITGPAAGSPVSASLFAAGTPLSHVAAAFTLLDSGNIGFYFVRQAHLYCVALYVGSVRQPVSLPLTSFAELRPMLSARTNKNEATYFKR
jgi:hypothetical protein